MTDVVIVSAARTAVGKFGGSLAKIAAPDLGAIVLRAVLERANLRPEQISEVILGQVLTPPGFGVKTNPDFSSVHPPD